MELPAARKNHLLLLVLPFALGSCSSGPTFGDRLISQGDSTREVGEKCNKGHAMIAEGEKMQEKGHKMVRDGEELIRKGEKSVERGKELKAAAGGGA